LEVLLLFNFGDVKKTYYETLGVAQTAAAGEIKRAYFCLVRKYQPDRFPEEFKEIRAAYETLMDGQKRAEYDAIGRLPSSVALLFHEAQRLDRFGRRGKAAELYQLILKSHPELDNVREHYARSLSADDKTGKTVEVWEELCRRNPGNAHYARELGESYLDRGWNKKALAETRRALSLDRGSVDGWSTMMFCTLANLTKNSDSWDELQDICLQAIGAVKEVKADEWKKMRIYTYAFITSGTQKSDAARAHLREMIRIVRENGQNGRAEGRMAMKEILRFIPADALARFYPDLKEMAGLLPNIDADDRKLRRQLDAVRINFEIEGLVEKKFSEIFRDLFRILNSEFEETEEEELEVTAIEYILLRDRRIYAPQLKRLKEEIPELYALCGSFFNEVLRTRDPDKLMHQRAKKINNLKRRVGFFDKEDPDSAPPEIIQRAQPKIGRNDPCPCGSGKKYKKCCGA
jgi:curved DNA-binding protein CbpA